MIAILDFGGQYCHLISRRLRDLGVASRIFPSSAQASRLAMIKDLRGVILSGGARSVRERNAPRPDPKVYRLNVPILGICYGHQLIADALGGRVAASQASEYGRTQLTWNKQAELAVGIKRKHTAWMNHRDVVTKVPKDFRVTASTASTRIAAFEGTTKKIFGIQFHPEATHTENGTRLLRRFAIDICRCAKSSTQRKHIGHFVAEAKKALAGKRAIIGLSGGIDSTVAALIVGKAIRKRLTAVYVDTGLMREGETAQLRTIFRRFPFTTRIIRADTIFFRRLKGTIDPEAKRKTIGKAFIDVFSKEAKRARANVLIQGTIYPDRIESGATKHSSNIKSHHNVGGLPKNLKLALYEPLRDLYKDEVRRLAKELRLPDEITTRQVFPGPGLAIRILGEVTEERVAIVRRAGAIIEEELRKTPHWKRIWMSFSVLLPVRSVGTQGDERSYKYPIVLRVVESKDVMSSNFSHLPYQLLERISTRITNEVAEVNRVVYDITNKPPATMEWE